MKPYYERDGITIYHGDCREVLPMLGPVDVTITDPPYQSLDVQVGKGTTTRLVSRDQFSGKRLAASDGGPWFGTLAPCEILTILDGCRGLLRDTGALYVFGDVKSGLALFPGWTRNVIVWDKGKLGMGYAWRRMHEWIAYQPMKAHKLRDMSLGDIIRCPGVEDKQHPTEKPLGVITPLIRNSTDPGETILDPFMGSGTTLRAAKDLGRRAVGIELEEKWCEVAAKRLSQEVLL
jgi:site-specific DNA-methyltransferase (adenine-specific)